ncbi:MAG: hypothetical protein ACJ8FG_04380 [Sphingomicrobium sp.]
MPRLWLAEEKDGCWQSHAAGPGAGLNAQTSTVTFSHRLITTSRTRPAARGWTPKAAQLESGLCSGKRAMLAGAAAGATVAIPEAAQTTRTSIRRRACGRIERGNCVSPDK